MIFMVWDALNADESEAKEFCENDPYDGRELQNLANGQPISVRATNGTLHRFMVGVVVWQKTYHGFGGLFGLLARCR